MAHSTAPSSSAVARPGLMAWTLIAAWVSFTALAMWWLNPIGVADLFELCGVSI